MDDLIALGCPHCGSVLSVRNLPNIQSKAVTCPVCKQKSRVSECRIIKNGGEEPTQYPNQYQQPQQQYQQPQQQPMNYQQAPQQQQPYQQPMGNPNHNPTIGIFPQGGNPGMGQKGPQTIIEGRTIIYGANQGNGGYGFNNQPSGYILGQLSCPATGQKWRLHVGRNIIGRDASTTPADIRIATPNKRISRDHLIINVTNNGNSFKHSVSLAKEAVNTTYVNNTQLEYGDAIVLNPNDRIILPSLELIFTLPENDNTCG